MKDEKLKYQLDDKPKSLCFWYELPESRQQLVKMLTENESEKFIDFMAHHVLIMTPFIDVLDEIFETGKS
ncbi:MAG TPA: hypothetical protein VL171_12570 [Verrucomicrobiae bacterium]|nr:hypothetical protein [Verrucomicrobiae bacterium]